MTRKYTNRRYLDALENRVLIYDGAMGTSLQQQNLTAEQFGGERYNGCNDFLVISYPQAVERVHRSFLDVGVDVIETDTFRANRLTLGEYGLSGRTVEINRAAAELAPKIRVNAVAPGVIDTPFHERYSTPKRMEGFRENTPLKRNGKAIHVARAIQFLIENDFITGETIDINGGLFMR